MNFYGRTFILYFKKTLHLQVGDVAAHVRAPDRCPNFIICNTKSITLNAKFIVFNAKLYTWATSARADELSRVGVLNAQFLVLNEKTHHFYSRGLDLLLETGLPGVHFDDLSPQASSLTEMFLE